jgi:hypothetical protein
MDVYFYNEYILNSLGIREKSPEDFMSSLENYVSLEKGKS